MIQNDKIMREKFGGMKKSSYLCIAFREMHLTKALETVEVG